MTAPVFVVLLEGLAVCVIVFVGVCAEVGVFVIVCVPVCVWVGVKVAKLEGVSRAEGVPEMEADIEAVCVRVEVLLLVDVCVRVCVWVVYALSELVTKADPVCVAEIVPEPVFEDVPVTV